MKHEQIVICNIWIIFGLTISSEAVVDLWKQHLQLYKRHCGEVALCDDVTSHLEPLEIPTLVPCCVPCSCLPTCSERHNCCPDFGYPAKYITDNGTITGEFETYHVNQSSIGSEDDVDSDESTRQKREVKRSQYFNLAKSTKHSNQNQLDSEIIGTRMSTIGEDAKLETRKTRESANTVCVRPQILYKPNVYIDSAGYMMVATCKETFRHKKIIDKCHTAMEKLDISEMLPVTSKLTGLTYINSFCLMCNEGNPIDDTIADFWDAKIVTYADFYRESFVLNPNELIGILKGFVYGNSNIHFTPRSGNVVQQCEAYDITFCNQTGLWEDYDEMIERICHYGQSLPILHRISPHYESMRFKNIACVHCNVRSSFINSSLSCRHSVRLDYRDYESKSYSQTMNLKNTNLDGATENGSLHISYTDEAVLQLPKTKVCQRGYIALLGYCRRIICPRGQYIHNSKCVPLYQRFTGMDLNVKVEVFPSRNIPKKFASYFLDELWLMVNTSMSKCITLQSNATSVWFGPIGRPPPDKYYMFDIYLFNASDTIEYSDAVKEVRDFFNELKTYGKLSLPDSTNIELYFKFNHRLRASFELYKDNSVNAGGVLRPLVGKLLDRRPNMIISNVNWCYRVAFEEAVGDVQIIDLNAFFIKPANITVYRQQFDEPGTSGVDWLLYLCIDLFRSHKNTENSDERYLVVNEKGKQDGFKPSIPLENGNYESSGMNSPVSIIIVSVLGLLVLVAGLYWIRFTINKPIKQTGVHVSLDILHNDESDRKENI